MLGEWCMKIKLYGRYKEFVLYILFGVLTTAVNYSCYFLFLKVFSLYYIFSNLISWIITVIFAFVVNKAFVFFSKAIDIKTVSRELIMFVAARIVSLLVETAGLYVMVDMFLIDDMTAKLITFIIVILLNYFISKLLIFKH